MLQRTRAYDLTFLFPAGDTAVDASLGRYGEFARVILDFLLAEADGGGVLIDVGANIGSIGLPFAARRPDWRVIAIEAHPGLADILAANVTLNRLPNVEVLRAAAGAAPGVAAFPDVPLAGPRNYGQVGFASEAPTTRQVRMVSLDEIAPPDTKLVKIDVEGFEPDVLAGARDLLASHRAVWLVEAALQAKDAAREAIAALQAAGYSVHWFYAPFVTPMAERGAPSEVARGDSNVVALPPGFANRWSLTPVARPDEPRPMQLKAYPHLVDYGYAPQEREDRWR